VTPGQLQICDGSDIINGDTFSVAGTVIGAPVSHTFEFTEVR